MGKRLAGVMVLVLALGSCQTLWSRKEKNDVLFPRREYVRITSEAFFKHVNMSHPLIAKVDFFARSNAYLSAYLELALFLEKHPHINKILPAFAALNKDISAYIERFTELKQDISETNYRGYVLRLKNLNGNLNGALNGDRPIKINGDGINGGINGDRPLKNGAELKGDELKGDELKFYLTVLYTLVDDYRGNRLSGDFSFRMWNILLSLIETAYSAKEKTVENAAILTAASQFIFFKNHKKWKKRALKILKKLPVASGSPESRLIFEK